MSVSRKSKFILLFISLLLLVLSFSIFFGKLFAYAPYVIGYEKKELQHIDIYAAKGSPLKLETSMMDSIIAGVEQFHELKFLKKPELFFFPDSAAFIQRSPSNARMCVFYNGRLFVSPWAVRESSEGKISLTIYLTHELSHVLLHQHSGIIKSYFYPKWLLEGIAVYSAHQMGTSFYPGKEETYRLIQQGNFMPPEYFKTKKEDEVTLNVHNRIPFMYSEFACMVDYLISRYGKDKFLTYMKLLMTCSDHNRCFQQVYGFDFNRLVDDFKAFVLTSTTSVN